MVVGVEVVEEKGLEVVGVEVVDQAQVVAEEAEEDEGMVTVVVVAAEEKGLEEAAGPEAECLETPAAREAEGLQILWLAADLQMTLAQSPESQG